MAVRSVRLGDPREEGEGVRLGTVRRLPRGVKKADYAKRNYFDQWLPELAPSAPLVKWVLEEKPPGDARWKVFERKYRREMAQPVNARLLQTLALLSHQADFSIGCYCERPDRCHRSILERLLAEHGAKLAGP
jgi:uncharacterized protein YeaO (DUF488 family)